MNKTEYMAAVNAAKSNPSKWSHQAGVYSLTIGVLTLQVTHAPTVSLWTMELQSGEELAHGSSQTAQLAQQEALLYADHYVRTVLHAELV